VQDGNHPDDDLLGKGTNMKMMMKKAVVAAVSAMAFTSVQAQVIDWVISPDGNALAASVTVLDGVAQFGSPDGGPGSQPVGIYGAGFQVSGGSSVTLQFDADLNTWDSYNAPGSTPFSGYWDAFIVTISQSDYYWNLPHTDPIAASASTFVWGGTNFGDGIKESYITAPAGPGDFVTLSGDGGTYYVSLVLDTKTAPDVDTQHPSYGSFHVTPIPEPEIYAMLAAGLGLMGFVGRRRRKEQIAA